jgi:hypothetical protein
MPFQSFEFDESIGQTEPGRPHVPEGYYRFQAVKLDPTPEDYSGTTGVLLTVKFAEAPDHAPGAGVGREMRDYSALAGKKSKDGRGSQFGLGQTLGAFGLSAIAKKFAERNPDGTAKVKINTYTEFENLCVRLTGLIAGKFAVGLVANQPSNRDGREFSGIEEWLPDEDWATLKRSNLATAAPRSTAVSTNGPAREQAVTQAVRSAVDDLFN